MVRRYDFPKKFLLQLRREAFDFRFRKAHHRTFDGLTVAEATGEGVGSDSEANKNNSYVKIPKMCLGVSPPFFLFFAELNFLQKPSNTLFSHIKLATEFVGHLWS